MTSFNPPSPPPLESRPASRARRRDRRLISPLDAQGRDALAEALARRINPTFDLFLFLIAAATLAALAIAFNSRALLLAAALLAPVITPLFGTALAAVTGAGRFGFRALGALSVSLGLGFVTSVVVAGVVRLAAGPESTGWMAQAAARSTAFDFVLSAAGAALAALALARAPESARLPNVALAYELLASLGGVAFGLAAGRTELAALALGALLGHIAVALLAASAANWALGFRPVLTGSVVFGVDRAFLTAGVLGVALLGLNVGTAGVYFREPVAAVAAPPTAVSEPTATVTIPTATPTLVATAAPSTTPSFTAVPTDPPSPTPSLTPTPLLARVMSSERLGAVMRDQPDGRIIANLPEEALVRILQFGPTIGEFQWLLVADAFGNVGWMAAVNAATLTPVP